MTHENCKYCQYEQEEKEAAAKQKACPHNHRHMTRFGGIGAINHEFCADCGKNLEKIEEMDSVVLQGIILFVVSVIIVLLATYAYGPL